MQGRAQGQGLWPPAGQTPPAVPTLLLGQDWEALALTSTARDVAQVVDSRPDACDLIWPLPVTIWGNLSKPLSISVPRVPHVGNRDDEGPASQGCWKDVMHSCTSRS